MAGENKLEVAAREKITLPPLHPEQIASVEEKAEKAPFAPEKSQEILKAGETVSAATRAVTPVTLSYQEQRAQAIDLILSEGLNEVFLKMNAAQQQEFKKRGEETVKKINTLLDKTKIKAGKIIDLIRAWLKLIPGINRFFLEQEAKIKADKIIKVKDTF
jgi:hypothetical protein